VFADGNPYEACAYSAATRPAPVTTPAIMQQHNSVGDLHQGAQLQAGRVSASDGVPNRSADRSRRTLTGSLAQSRASDARPKGSATGAAEIGLRKLHIASPHSTEPCRQSGDWREILAGPPRNQAIHLRAPSRRRPAFSIGRAVFSGGRAMTSGPSFNLKKAG
jgi:hypothetical protein